MPQRLPIALTWLTLAASIPLVVYFMVIASFPMTYGRYSPGVPELVYQLKCAWFTFAVSVLLAIRFGIAGRRLSVRRLLAELAVFYAVIASAWAAAPILGPEPDQFVHRVGADVYRIPESHLTYGRRHQKGIAFCPSDLRGLNELRGLARKDRCHTIRVSIWQGRLVRSSAMRGLLDETLGLQRDGDRLLSLPGDTVNRIEGDGWTAFLDFPNGRYETNSFAVDRQGRIVMVARCSRPSCFVESRTDVGVLHYTLSYGGSGDSLSLEAWRATDAVVLSLFDGWRVEDAP